MGIMARNGLTNYMINIVILQIMSFAFMACEVSEKHSSEEAFQKIKF